MARLILLSVLYILFATGKLIGQDKPKKTKVEEVTKICEGLDPSQKPLVAVMPFKIGAAGANQAVGTGLPDMLTNAIFNTGCFRVVERERLNDIMKEQGLGLSGAGDENSFAPVGKLAGAQVLVFGTITEFTENESGGGGGGGGLIRGLKGKLGVAAGAVGVKTAHIGYTLKFVNPTTGEFLDTKSFDKSRTSVGAAGGGIFSGGVAGGGFYKSKSMQDAVEESLIEAVEYMSQNKSAYAGVVNARNAAATGAASVSKENCALLKTPNKPSIMVILPEEHVAGAGSNYDPYRGLHINITVNSPVQNGMAAYISTAPCLAGETEISRKLTEFGLRLKDASQLEKIKKDQSFQDAFNSNSDASKIGARFGADIIIVGDAFSEYSKNANGLVSCRATVSVKAVMTKDASIIATQSFKASGLDATELVAGKTALQNASSKIADYLLSQFCAKSDDIASLLGNQKSTSSNANSNETDIQFNNVDFNKALALGKIIQSVNGVSKSERLSFSDKIAKFSVTHTGDSNSLIEKIVNNKMGIKLDVKSLEGNLANIDVK